ncbi:MAG: M81 family metallopeptidase [Rhodospirillaceae bacterium]|jgi:microcystin degradation protein MlrC|nr:M81 family metallopeptidase [Rhodospirillaceae bacterium]
MRILVAMMKHETNTFSPVRTDWARFQSWGAHEGQAAYDAYKGTGMPFGAYIGLAEAAGHEVVTPLAAEAMPSGKVEAEAYRHMTDAILSAVPECDAAMLDLHGAMVAEETDDGEGTLLERIRAIKPDLPICVTYDLHTNLTQKMVDNCTCMIGYKTYPHIDMVEVGTQIANVLLAALEDKVHPVIAWGRPPLLAQTLRMGHDDEPMMSLLALAREAEADPKILAATVFGGFPLADFHDAGSSICVVADGDMALAEHWRDRLLEHMWANRDEFVYQHEPLGDALVRAKEMAEKIDDGPVLLLDHADNVGSGGTMDVMTVIAEVLRQDLEDVAVAAVYDPAAVQTMQKAGIGASVTLKLGGKTDMPSIDRAGEPLEVTGKVKMLSDGEWIVRGPMYTGVRVKMGHSAVLDTGKVEIVITSIHHEPWDVGVFTSLGIQPEYKKYLLLKSRIHYRAGFGDLGKATVTCDGHGVTTSDNSILDFEKVRRPIYPLDQINEP